MVSPFDLPRCESLATMVSVCMFAPLSLATLVATRSQLVKSHYTYTNFAPRLGLAYSPKFQSGLLEKIFGSSGTTSVRAGYGAFYTAIEGLSAGIMSHAQFYGPAAVNGNISSANFGQVVSAASPRLVQLAAKFFF